MDATHTVDATATKRITAFESVLVNATLLTRIISFQDGLPGLLRSLKRDLSAYGGNENDLPVAAVKRRKLRALEMIDSLRTLPQYRNRYEFNDYSYAAAAACKINDVACFQWILSSPTAEHRLTRKQLKDLWSSAVKYFQHDDFRIVESLAQYFTPAQVAKLDDDCWSGITNLKLLQWLHDRFSILAAVPDDVFFDAISRGDSAMIDYWLENRPESVPTDVLSNALESSDTCESWALYLKLQLNSTIVPDADEWSNLVYSAVQEEDVTLVKLLHTHSATYPFSKPPVQALEIAAASGHVEIVEELYEHHKDTGKIITARALELAATNGHIHVLQFLATHSQFEGVPEALDSAAAKGHLQCVRFLHESGRFTATTSAMDTAATNGHFAVVQYLHTHRSEGCTAQAVAGAAENDQDDVTTWLLANRSEVRSAAGLDALLLAGKTSEWLMYRDEWALRGDDAVDSPHHLGKLLFQAGRRGKMAAMRFLCTSLNQSDQLHRAYEGAVEIGSVSWLFAIQSLGTTPQLKRVQFSTIARAVALEWDNYRFEVSENERLDAIKWLVMQCNDKDEYNAMQDALQLLVVLHQDENGNDLPGSCRCSSCTDRPYEQLDLVMALTRWGERRQPPMREMKALRNKYSSGVFDFAVRGGAACDWVLEQAVCELLPRFTSWNERQFTKRAAQRQGDDTDSDPWRLGEWTIPKRAVARNDLTLLRLCREWSQSPLNNKHDDDDDDDDRLLVDDSVLTAAIAAGHVEVVQWYLSECWSSDKETTHSPLRLLETAIQYGQPHVADWLLREMPQCATQLSADCKLGVWPQYVDARIVDWLNHLQEHTDLSMLLAHVEPLAIAQSLAHAGHVELLTQFLSRHPQLRADKVTAILQSAGEGGHLHAVEFVCDVMEKQTNTQTETDVAAIQKAMALAAKEGHLEMVTFLFRQFPTVSWLDAVRAASQSGEVRVLRFLFMNGYAHCAADKEMYDEESSCDYVVRRLAYFCQARGAESL